MNASAAVVAEHPIDRSAHVRALQIGVPAVVARLSGVLGQALVASIVGKDVRSVKRWAQGAVAPTAATERALRDALQVLETVASVEADPIVRAWFMGMNPQLDDQAPAEALHMGRARETMAAARAFLNA